MAVKSSGPLAMTDIVNEFGGSAPHSLNEYYGVASGIATSGAITYSSFYGASAVISLTYPAGNHQKVNLESWVTGLGYSVPNSFEINIASGTTFWSNDIGVPALTTGNLGSLILNNNGIIMGKGGDACSFNIPNGFRPQTSSNWGFTLTAKGWRSNLVAPSQAGGPALAVNCTAIINNSGYIAGGGAGGPQGGNAVWEQFASGAPLTQPFFALATFDEEPHRHRAFESSGGNIKFVPGLSRGWGGGAGGGRGGRTTLMQHSIIGEDIPHYPTDQPPAITGIGQSGRQAFRQLGPTSAFNVQSVGLNEDREATPADGGGGIGNLIWSSQTNLGGGSNY